MCVCVRVVVVVVASYVQNICLLYLKLIFLHVGGFLITHNNIKIGKIRHTTRCVC